MNYISPYLNRLFIQQRAAEMARRYDERVVHYINIGFDLKSARNMADASVRYDLDPEEQRDYQADTDRAVDSREWMVRRS